MLTSRPVLAAILIVAELCLLILLYQLSAALECRLTGAETACLALRSIALRTLTMLFALLVFLWLDRGALDNLLQRVRETTTSHLLLALHGIGVGLMILPVLVFGADGVQQSFQASLLLMAVGALLSGVGLIRWVLPFRAWWGWLRRDSWKLPLVAAIALLLPELAALVAPIWTFSTLNVATFDLVAMVLRLSSAEVLVEPDIMGIGVDGFHVIIASQCSGVEGFALVTGFMAIYALLLRGDLQTWRYWGVLFPLAILASWILNILRIAGLILLGAYVSPEHAVNGFHSYAGWLMFTLMSIGIVIIAEYVPWFHKRQRQPVRIAADTDDPVPLILPFAVMMLSAVLAATFWPDPDLGYPLRVLMMVGILAVFWRYLVKLPWRFDPVSLVAGLAIGVVWIVFAEPLTGATKTPDTFWIIMRITGTIALVPIIEELFFRGYILKRLNSGGLLMMILALGVSTGLFALLHGKWILAVFAGLVLGGIYLRRNRVTDAIQAHASANSLIAIWAFVTGNWTLI